MSDFPVYLAVKRITTAPPDQRLAVFKSIQPGRVDVVFHDTAKTIFDMRTKPDQYIGTFHDNADPGELRALLEAVARA